MEVNSENIKRMRLERNWTQQHLADTTNLTLRTIQRIEGSGAASNESISSLCSVFEVERAEIMLIPRVDESQLSRVRRPYIFVFLAFLTGVVGGVLGSTFYSSIL